MARMQLQNAVLLIIDVQQGFDEPSWGARNNPQAEQNIAKLLKHWRVQERPVVHVQHLSLEPGSTLREDQPGSAFKPETAPRADEPVYQKHVNSAFIGTSLEDDLRSKQYDTLVIVGLTTNHCVSTTARMAGNLGFKTFVISDATATFDREGLDGTIHKAHDIHAISLASLHGEFATVLSTNAILSAKVKTH